MPNLSLLEQLCTIHAPSGEEFRVFDYIQSWLLENKIDATVDRESVFNAMFVKKGNPYFAFLVHADTVGFIKQYGNKVLSIGSPEVENNLQLKDSFSNIFLLTHEEGNYYVNDNGTIETGTTFTFYDSFEANSEFIQAPYLDNRLHVAIALEVIKSTENVMFVFTSNEEIGGGCTEKVARELYHKYFINRVIILDTTFVSEGIYIDKGIVLSLKDEYLPSRSWVYTIKDYLKNNKIPIQLEVAEYGSSDGAYISKSPYPIYWCFLGIACENYHSPKEKVSVNDVQLMEKALILLTNSTINLKYL